MRVLFPDISDPRAGKGFFLNALARELPNHGIDVVFCGPADVGIFNRKITSKCRIPFVLRFDGVYHDIAVDWRAKNAGMIDAASKAAVVMCQSMFGREMVKRYLKVPEDKICVSLNGSDPNAFVEQVSPADFSCQAYFIAAARWRPHKRLRDTIDAFLEANIPDTKLLVVGDMGKGMAEPLYRCDDARVVMLGPVTNRARLLGMMRSAAALVHLCWFDCCPNVVVEAVCQGAMVICSNQGGTKEIVGPSGGMVIDLDEEYDYRPVDLYNPPRVDLSKVAGAMWAAYGLKRLILCDHVSIANAASNYSKAFRKAMLA